uniref:Protein TIFY n=1 Tax=Gentiana crassa subsp. rigescens TaxID=3097545 RepID=A0A0U2EYP8_9GENT|nr:JAZ1 [Gentiana rigescens]
MGLSGFVETGRFSGGQRSNINQTCSLLNQYLKKNGNFEDLNLGFNRTFFESDTEAPTKTMDFLPMIENAGKKPEAQQIAANSEPEKAQLTIFYAGQVIVFDDFPADKVDEIMALANGGNTNKNFTCTNTTMVPTAPNMVTTPPATVAPSFAINMVQDNQSPMALTKINDLPIARKNSLARFLEKRKDRIIASSPYQRNNKGDATSKAGP